MDERSGRLVDELDWNIAAYERLRSDLEREHVGEWVVIRAQTLVGLFDSFNAAADADLVNYLVESESRRAA